MHLTMEGLRREAADTQCPLTPQMVELMDELRLICKNPSVVRAYDEAASQMTPYIDSGDENPWRNSTIDHFVEYFEHWFTFLPTPKTGLDRIMSFIWFYTHNKAALRFLNTFKSCREGSEVMETEIFNWTVKFIEERGRFMDSKESLFYIDHWLDDPGVYMEDFKIPEGGFKSFNDFFTRSIDHSKNKRPIDSPDDDEVVVAPTDSMVNYIMAHITLKTELDVKKRRLNVGELLEGSKYAEQFEGGTAVSFLLFPDYYHHYHSPANGHIVEGREIPGIHHGLVNEEHWFDDVGSVERPKDFSIFGDFHRAYYIIKTKGFGYLAVVPVGLHTVSRLTPTVVHRKSTMVKPGDEPVYVKKGDELGYFAYGGSLVILLFQKACFKTLSVKMGQRIGKLLDTQ